MASSTQPRTVDAASGSMKPCAGIRVLTRRGAIAGAVSGSTWAGVHMPITTFPGAGSDPVPTPAPRRRSSSRRAAPARAPRLRVLLVEADARLAEATSAQLDGAGFEVVGLVDSEAAAIAAAQALRPDLVLMDNRLKRDIDGVGAANALRHFMLAPIIYLAVRGDAATLQHVAGAVAVRYSLSPTGVGGPPSAIEAAVERFRVKGPARDGGRHDAPILGFISEGVLTTDARGRIRYMNAVAERLTGWSATAATGVHASAVVVIAGPTGPARPVHPVERVLSEAASVTLGADDYVVARDQTRVPVEGVAAPLLGERNETVGTIITVRDATAARGALAERNMLSERLHAVLDAAADGIMLFDAHGEILTLNPAGSRLSGYPADEIVGQRVARLMSWPLAADGGQMLGIESAPGESATLIRRRIVQCRRKDGSVFPAELSVTGASLGGREVFVASVHDLSERRRLEASLLDAIGYEQRRVGYEIHDGLGQELTGLAILIEALVRATRVDQRPATAALEQIGRVAARAIQSCRDIAHGSAPISGTAGGLAAGLRALVARLRELPGPAVSLTITESSELEIAPEAIDHLYRIAQEALANALKHAHARSIELSFHVDNTMVRLKICDDGKGLRPRPCSGEGLGLHAMGYRATAIGARLSITAGEHAGTCVLCECPQSGPPAVIPPLGVRATAATAAR